MEPKIFLNDFLEILYYVKNISSIKLDGNNFSLNDEEFREIELISKEINSETLLLFWQFTIKTLGELDIVSNQNLSMEMFLIRLMHLKEKKNSTVENNIDLNYERSLNNPTINKKINLTKEEDSNEINNKTISQIKNFSQKETFKLDTKEETKLQLIEIKNFEHLIDLCTKKKELKLKYELETNVSLVSFAHQKIEISFNENLDKDFVKELSSKLNRWTGQRWIIAFSKEIGQLSRKNKKNLEKSNFIELEKKGDIYQKIVDKFPDAELIDVKIKDDEQ